MLSDDEIDIHQMDEAPNAVFVIFSDERVTRHRFTTLFVTQAYKELVDKADMNSRKKETDTMILKRRCHFILEEFGNLPKFEGITNMITVARSRGIRFLLILQSFTQLNATYGAEVSGVIRDNCNVKIFIGTDDAATRKEFSELCGQRKTKQFSVNTNVEHPASSSTGATLQPLITVGELELLNGNEKGNAIVSVRGYRPIWSHFTPSFELRNLYFPEGKGDSDSRKPRFYDKDSIVYDIMGDEAKPAAKKVGGELRQMDLNDVKTVRENRRKRTEVLDEKWAKIESEINKRVHEVCATLSDEDARDIEEARLDDKAMLLYTLMNHYTDSIAQKMRITADYLQDEALPEMLELQKKATKVK